MVCRLDPANCLCGHCDGGQRAPEGYFGGTFCPCECHSLEGEALKKFIAARQKPFEELIDAAYRKLHNGL